MDNSTDNDFSPEFSNDGYFDENTEVDVGDYSNIESHEGRFLTYLYLVYLFLGSISQIKFHHVKKYIIWEQFERRDEFSHWWSMAEVKDSCTPTRKEFTEYWICKYARKRGCKCNYSGKVEFNEERVKVMRTEDDHDHSQDANDVAALTQKVKDFVKERMEYKKPGQIHVDLVVK